MVLTDTLAPPEILPEKIQYHRHPGTTVSAGDQGLIPERQDDFPEIQPHRSRSNRLNLAILGQEQGFRIIRSGPGGSFNFVLDSMSGRNDMYIVSNHDDKTLEIRIDNDFAKS